MSHGKKFGGNFYENRRKSKFLGKNAEKIVLFEKKKHCLIFAQFSLKKKGGASKIYRIFCSENNLLSPPGGKKS